MHTKAAYGMSSAVLAYAGLWCKLAMEFKMYRLETVWLLSLDLLAG